MTLFAFLLAAMAGRSRMTASAARGWSASACTTTSLRSCGFISRRRSASRRGTAGSSFARPRTREAFRRTWSSCARGRWTRRDAGPSRAASFCCAHCADSAVILGKPVRAIQTRGAKVIPLRRRSLEVMLALSRHFRRRWTGCPPARTIEAISWSAGHNRRAIDVDVAKTRANAQHGRVVAENVPGPHSAQKADADVAEAVVHTAVKSDVRTPVSFMPHIDSVDESPIPRRPQQTHCWRQHPHARNPEIPRIAVSPISRCPKVTGRRTNRHLRHRDYRKNRRRDPDRHQHLGLHHRHGCQQHQRQRSAKMYFHNLRPFLLDTTNRVARGPLKRGPRQKTQEDLLNARPNADPFCGPDHPGAGSGVHTRR